MRMPHTFHPQTLDAAQLLGLEVARVRRERRWTATDLAERAGIAPVTLRKIEKGDPTVELGSAFEVATLLGIVLFAPDRRELSTMVEHARTRLALLPARVRESAGKDHDAF
ncbi:MAG: helix-turn-helix domain-containing protein [Actinomycetales bacterium]|nr:helix-turn-helix domain-containing protein [Actinomycetales bacterium]